MANEAVDISESVFPDPEDAKVKVYVFGMFQQKLCELERRERGAKSKKTIRTADLNCSV